MILTLFVCSACLSCLFTSCSTTNEKKNKQWNNIDISKIEKQVNKLKISQIGKSIRYIPLETTDESLLEGNFSIQLLSQEILVSTGKHCMLFDRETGKYLRKIGSVGEHLGGYSSPICFVKQQDETLYFHRRQGNKLIGYDKKGTLVSEIFLPTSTTSFSYPVLFDSIMVFSQFGFPGEKIKHRIYVCNFRGEGLDSVLNNQCFPQKEDMSKGIEVKSVSFYKGLSTSKERPYGLLFRNGGLVLNKIDNTTEIIPVHYPNLWNLNDKIHFHEIFSDTIFQFQDGLLTPRWVFQTGNRHLTMQKREIGLKDGTENSLVITDVLETNSQILFHCSMDVFDKPKSYQGLYLKESGEVFLSKGENGFIDDINNFLPIHPVVCGSNGEFVDLLSIEDIQIFFEKNSNVELDKSIMDLKTLEYDANPVCVIIEPF